MEAPRDSSIGDLIDTLLVEGRIDACHMTREYVTVVQGAQRHSLAYRKARSFLLGLLEGRAGEENDAAAPPGEDVTPMRAVGKARASALPLEPALDELLRMAEEMRIIEGHERSSDAPGVRIVLSSCETELREQEAVAFLAECILHKLSQLRGSRDVARTPAVWEEPALVSTLGME